MNPVALKGCTLLADRIAISTHGISKSFGQVRALRNVSIDFYSGSITGLVGDNGAGKSSLVKCLTGVLRPDRGYINVGGLKCAFMDPRMAIESGISAVYQDLSLVDSLSVSDNIFLGRELKKYRFFLDRKKMRASSSRILESLGIVIPSLFTAVGKLSGGQRQAIAVARAVSMGGRILIFDEPTAAMGVAESRKILSLIKSLGGRGFTVIVISHNLDHLFMIADRICVLRHGEFVGDYSSVDSSSDEIVRCITGFSGRNGAL